MYEFCCLLLLPLFLPFSAFSAETPFWSILGAQLVNELLK